MFPMHLVRMRRDRLSADHYGDLSGVNTRLSEQTLTNILKPLQYSKLDKQLSNVVVSALEFAAKPSVQLESAVSNLTLSNILPGVEDLGYFSSRVESISESLSEETVTKISSGIRDMKVCDRILKNDAILNNRYDIGKVIREFGPYRVEDCISELCFLIDTYDMPVHAKYNIALENILYVMTNEFGNSVTPETVLECVTGYFITKNPVPDFEYNKIVGVLQGSKVYDMDIIKSVPITNAMLSKDIHTNLKKLNVLSTWVHYHVTARTILAVNDIGSENEAIEVIKNMCKVSREVDSYDAAIIKSAARLIPEVYPVEYGFVDKMWARYNGYGSLPGESIAKIEVADSDITPPFDIKNATTEELATHSFCEGVQDNEDMKKLLQKFKAEQKKTVPMLRRLMSKLYSKEPKDVIDELPNLFGIIRIAFISALVIIPVVGPVLAVVAALINWFIKNSISQKDATKLLEYLKKEKATVEKKIDRTSGKEQKRYQEYLSEIDKSIKKVNTYLEDIDGTDRNSPMDDFDDMSLDEQVAILQDVTTMASKIAEQEFHNLPSLSYNRALTMIKENSYIDNYYMNSKPKNVVTVSECEQIANTLIQEDVDAFRDFIGIMHKSSLREEAIDILEDMYHSHYHEDVQLTTEASTLYQKLCSDESVLPPLGEIASTYFYDEALNNIRNVTVLQEFKLNDVKLLLQDVKRKAKDMDTKLRSMAQTANANASGVINSIEKSMTSDRREAIIKGRLLPSFTQMIKYVIAMAGAGVAFGPTGAIITALGLFAVNKSLTYREKKMILDEIETELKVVEKQIQIAENDQDMKQYRTLLNVQKKLVRERQRIKYNMRAIGKNMPVPSVTVNNRD